MFEKSGLPILRQLEIESPCHANWDEMEGDSGRRYCEQCEKYVFNFAEMDADAVGYLVGSGEKICARIKKRSDGSIVTREESISRRSWLGRLGALAASVFGLGMIAGCTTSGESQADQTTSDDASDESESILGGLRVPPEEDDAAHS